MIRATTTDLIALCEKSLAGQAEPAQIAEHAADFARHLRQFIQSDDYLRAIRSEELDGSERELGELLERNTDLFHGIEETTS